MNRRHPVALAHSYPAVLPRGAAAARARCAPAGARRAAASAPHPQRLPSAPGHAQAWKIAGEFLMILGVLAVAYFACIGIAGTMLGWSISG